MLVLNETIQRIDNLNRALVRTMYIDLILHISASCPTRFWRDTLHSITTGIRYSGECEAFAVAPLRIVPFRTTPLRIAPFRYGRIST